MFQQRNFASNAFTLGVTGSTESLTAVSLSVTEPPVVKVSVVKAPVVEALVESPAAGVASGVAGGVALSEVAVFGETTAGGVATVSDCIWVSAPGSQPQINTNKTAEIATGVAHVSKAENFIGLKIREDV
jgi:hypothetical protein